MTSNNVTNCPLSFPFVLINTTNCSACPAEAPVFDVNSRKCIKCPENYAYDDNVHQCVLNITCPTGFHYDEQKKSCICNDVNPYYNGTACLSCFLPNYWNRTSLKCESCPAGSIYKI